MKEANNIIFSTDNEKLTEKAFMKSIAVSVLCILLCMIALCSTTWAYFSLNISASANTIKSAYCDVIVSVKTDDSVINTVDGIYKLGENKAYEINITASGTAKTAYCILKIDGIEYYTVLIPTQTAENHIFFTLQFTKDTELEIIPRWGSSDKTKTSFNDGMYYLDLTESTPPAEQSSTETASSDTDDAEPSPSETDISEATIF